MAAISANWSRRAQGRNVALEKLLDMDGNGDFVSVLLFGASHLTAPVATLEQLAVSEADRPKLVEKITRSPHVSEAMLVSTCNRVEVYAVVDAFHPALDAVMDVMGEHSSFSVHDMSQFAHILYAEAAVGHLFAVASGMQSMVVGEQQILGQIRSAYASATEHGTAGRTLHELAQQALRVGKRVHHETGIDRAGASVVSVALGRCRENIPQLEKAVIVGAGAMGSLAAAQLVRDGVADIAVLNRTHERAEHLAARTEGAYAAHDLVASAADADVLVTCTGAIGNIVTLADVHQALTNRTKTSDLMICDLGLPRDVDPAVGRLPGVTVIDIDSLSRGSLGDLTDASIDVDRAQQIISDELSRYLDEQRRAEVAPTVTALRQRAAEVVEAELLRLEGRIDPAGRDEVAKSMRRVVDKLLHAPTVRVKQLAASGPQGYKYADALRELFQLNPQVPQTLSAATHGELGPEVAIPAASE